MSTAPLTIPRDGMAPATVDAQPVTPGLYIHPTTPVEDASPVDQWRLAHHSGRMIACFPTARQAWKAGRAVAQFTDWTLGEDELLARAQSREINLYDLGDIIDDHGGVLVRQRVLLGDDVIRYVGGAA